MKAPIVGVLITVLVAGCATLGGPPTIPRELGRPTNEQERRLLDTFVPRVVAAARAEGFKCAYVPVGIKDMPFDSVISTARPSTNPCAFFILGNPRFLASLPREHFAGDFAHELGHVMNGDWLPRRAQVPQITKEREADGTSIRILLRDSVALCLAQVENLKQVREGNIRSRGVEQWETVGTHPSFTERIQTFERECQRGSDARR